MGRASEGLGLRLGLCAEFFDEAEHRAVEDGVPGGGSSGESRSLCQRSVSSPLYRAVVRMRSCAMRSASSCSSRHVALITQRQVAQHERVGG